ncbi:MAG: phosphoribosyl-AMP cyclohydrolase [Spirochaetia bacterium]|nr:phosphoribosyl-AMP cyclohydrolase [Spirochaetia bacterium]
MKSLSELESEKAEPDFSKEPNGLLPAIAQEIHSGEILMVGYANAEAWGETLRSGKATFFSRSKKRLWTKGETSGNFLMVREIWLDCDRDTILWKVEAMGPACHENFRSCFFREVVRDKLVLRQKREG